MPVQYGIYCAALACLIGPLFSGSRFIALGPTNATSVMLMSTIGGMALMSDKLAAMPTLLLLVAVFLMLGALLGVANLIQYISRSVITGYITAAAILITANQLDSVMGFEIQGASTFIHYCSRKNLYDIGSGLLAVLGAGNRSRWQFILR